MKNEAAPFFTIIIPVYNTPLPFIQECIDSVLKQEYRDLELIIVDDGSKPDIAEFCDILEDRDERIYVIHQSNQGVSIARNNALSIAKGNYVIFLDADDMLVDDALIELQKYCIKGYDIVFHAYSMVYASGRSEKCKYFSSSQNLNKDKQQIVSNILYNVQNSGEKEEKYVPICTPWSKAIRRQIITEGKLKFNPLIKLGEDLVFNLYLIQHSKSFYYIDKELYLNRVNSMSCVNSYHADALERTELLVAEIISFIKKYSLDYLYDYFYGQYVILFCGLLNNYFVYKNAIELKDYIDKKEEVLQFFEEVNIKMLNSKKKLVVMLMRMKMFIILRLFVKFQNRYNNHKIN